MQRGGFVRLCLCRCFDSLIGLGLRVGVRNAVTFQRSSPVCLTCYCRSNSAVGFFFRIGIRNAVAFQRGGLVSFFRCRRINGRLRLVFGKGIRNTVAFQRGGLVGFFHYRTVYRAAGYNTGVAGLHGPVLRHLNLTASIQGQVVACVHLQFAVFIENQAAAVFHADRVFIGNINTVACRICGSTTASSYSIFQGF